MKAVQFDFNVPKWAFTKVAGRFDKKLYYGQLSCITLREVPEPEIRGPKWLKLRSVLSGFCGSDLGLIMLHDSPTTQPFASFPFTIGHENYSIVEEVGSEVNGFARGDRVALNAALGCEVRGIDPPCEPCKNGFLTICDNSTEGDLAPGMFTGFCRDTGGGWSKYYLAHESQVRKLPDSVTDKQAVMLEPLSSSLYPVLRAMPDAGDHVLVIGCGVIGLGVIACIRALGVDCHITAVEPIPLNAEKALEKGADEVINPAGDSIYERTVEITGARLYKPLIAKPITRGGFNRIYDCVGSTGTINEAFRVAAAEAKYVLEGITIPRVVDWAPVWMKGLTIIGNLGYGAAEYKGKTMQTMDIAIDMAKEGEIDNSDLITHSFSVDDYKEAIEVNMNKAANCALRTIFDLSDQ